MGSIPLGLDGRVSRLSFALAGVLLGALKFSVEAAWAWQLSGAIHMRVLTHIKDVAEGRAG